MELRDAPGGCCGSPIPASSTCSGGCGCTDCGQEKHRGAWPAERPELGGNGEMELRRLGLRGIHLLRRELPNMPHQHVARFTIESLSRYASLPFHQSGASRIFALPRADEPIEALARAFDAARASVMGELPGLAPGHSHGGRDGGEQFRRIRPKFQRCKLMVSPIPIVVPWCADILCKPIGKCTLIDHPSLPPTCECIPNWADNWWKDIKVPVIVETPSLEEAIRRLIERIKEWFRSLPEWQKWLGLAALIILILAVFPAAAPHTARVAAALA